MTAMPIWHCWSCKLISLLFYVLKEGVKRFNFNMMRNSKIRFLLTEWSSSLWGLESDQLSGLSVVKWNLLALSDSFPLLPSTLSKQKKVESSSADKYIGCMPSYQFNPHLTRDESTTNILAKALTVFPSPDFSLCLHLLPPHILSPQLSTSTSLPAAGDAPLSEAVQKLTTLNTLLSQANYKAFWSTLYSDDLYDDLTATVIGFEELMRVRIAATVGQSCREVDRKVLEGWLSMSGNNFERFVLEICGWDIEGIVVLVPANKENEAKGTVIRENVQIDREFFSLPLSLFPQPPSSTPNGFPNRKKRKRCANANIYCSRIRPRHQKSPRGACMRNKDTQEAEIDRKKMRISLTHDCHNEERQNHFWKPNPPFPSPPPPPPPTPAPQRQRPNANAGTFIIYPLKSMDSSRFLHISVPHLRII